MCTVPRPLRGVGQKRRRELQLGCGRSGHDARLRGDDDAVCALHLLRCRLGFRHRVRAPDLHQDEHGRGRRGQVDRVACRRVPFHHRSLDRVPRLFRLPHIGGSRTVRQFKIKVSLKNDKYVSENQTNVP